MLETQVTLIGMIENNVTSRRIILSISVSYTSVLPCRRCRTFISCKTRVWNHGTSIVCLGNKSNTAQIVSMVIPFCKLMLLAVVVLNEHESNTTTNCSQSAEK